MFKRFLLTIFVLFLTACEGVSPTKPSSSPEGSQSISAVPHIAIRQILQRLPNADKPERDHLLLRLADAQIKERQYDKAHSSLAQIDETQLSREQRVELMLLKAQQLQFTGRAIDGAKLLPKDQSDFPQSLRHRVLLTQAQVLKAAGYDIESTRARIQLHSLLQTDKDKNNNAKNILNSLSALPGARLQQLADKHMSEDMDSWAGFVLATKPYLFSKNEFDRAYQDWSRERKSHPIPYDVVREIRDNIKSIEQYPNKIALLLPLSSKFAKQAEGIRDGFLGAYHADNNADKPEILIIDSTAGKRSIAQQLQEARDKGAGMVVGPLLKSSIKQVQSMSHLPLPVLALNYSEDDGQQQLPHGFFQFGLLPEDEAQQAAKLALMRNQKRAAILAPKTRKGQRMISAFREAFEQGGGRVMSTESYQPRARDYSSSIKSLFNIQQSKTRKSILQTVLRRNLGFEPRIRKDIDVIYMVASPSQARGLVPQLQFYDAGDIPRLANSQLYNGIDNPTLNRDINGTVFTQSPWLLNAHSIPLHQSLKQLWPANMARHSKLYALGADAYQLVPYLGRMQQDTGFHKDGYTGTLSADRHGRIHRQLLWARFKDGAVELDDRMMLDMQADTQDSPTP